MHACGFDMMVDCNMMSLTKRLPKIRYGEFDLLQYKTVLFQRNNLFALRVTYTYIYNIHVIIHPSRAMALVARRWRSEMLSFNPILKIEVHFFSHLKLLAIRLNCFMFGDDVIFMHDNLTLNIGQSIQNEFGRAVSYEKNIRIQ